MLKLGGRASDYFHFPMELWQTSRVPLSSVETNRAGTSALRFVNMITPRFGVLALRGGVYRCVCVLARCFPGHDAPCGSVNVHDPRRGGASQTHNTKKKPSPRDA